MLKRVGGNFIYSDEHTSPLSRQLEERGYAIAEAVLSAEECGALAAEIEAIYEQLPPDRPNPDRPAADYAPFRYQMLNRSALCQRAVAHPRILEIIDPLLGGDCHVIANTAWRNPADDDRALEGGLWHIDAGPHVPRPPGTRWPDDIPYPVFAIGAHILLRDSTLDDGPTGVIPGSHRSGQPAPFERLKDPDLEYEGERCLPLLGRAGDALLFVSDVWHRRMPTTERSNGRFFLQVHYARRDIAQRLRPTDQTHQLSDEALSRARAGDERAQRVVGLHPAFFYDG